VSESCCTFFTYHEASGWFYLGKGITKKVLSGRYSGSGVKLKRVRKKYPKREWVTEILWVFENSDEALSDEGGLNIEELILDEKCCNLMPGGGGIACIPPKSRKQQGVKMSAFYEIPGNREAQREISNRPEVLANNIEKNKARWTDELREEQSIRATMQQNDPVTKQKGRDSKKARWTAELRIEQSIRASKPCTVDGLVIYPSYTKLVEALGRGKAGSRHPDFRYVEVHHGRT